MSAIPRLDANAPHDGVLMGTNDVIWVHTKQPAGKEMGVVVWPVADRTSVGADFDLMVSVDGANRLPPMTGTPPYRSIGSGNRPEFVVLPAPARDRTVYIAIGSWRGSGQFRFYANIHETSYPTKMRVVTDWDPSVQRRATIRTLLRKLVQSMYFATDGRHFVRRFDVHYDTRAVATPYIRFSGYQTANQAFTAGGHVNGCQTRSPKTSNDHLNYTSLNWCRGGSNSCEPALDPTCTCVDTQEFNERWAGTVALHEVGHLYYGLLDEYHPTDNGGHSVMGNDANEPEINLVDFCSAHNGGKDPDVGATGHSASASGWACLEKHYPSSPAFDTRLTPDAFYATAPQDQADRPFSSYVSIVEHN